MKFRQAFKLGFGGAVGYALAQLVILGVLVVIVFGLVMLSAWLQ